MSHSRRSFHSTDVFVEPTTSSNFSTTAHIVWLQFWKASSIHLFSYWSLFIYSSANKDFQSFICIPRMHKKWLRRRSFRFYRSAVQIWWTASGLIYISNPFLQNTVRFWQYYQAGSVHILISQTTCMNLLDRTFKKPICFHSVKGGCLRSRPYSHWLRS